MNKPFSSYKGSEPYVFVCYAHIDAETVYSDLKELNAVGIKFWYDEGIQAGSVWRAEIASSIKGANKFIFFISEASLKSPHCLREVDYALNNGIEVIPVYLDDSSLPDELELVFNRVQALFRHTDNLYMQHLRSALKTGVGRVVLKTSSGKRNLGYILGVLAFAVAVLVWAWMEQESDEYAERTEIQQVDLTRAFDPYSQGQELMNRWDKDDNLDVAIELFREASELDPTFALSFARLAEALRIRYALTGGEIWLEEAAEKAHEAERLNPGLAPVQVALGRIYASQGDHDMAFAATERAVSIDPNDAAANQAMSRIYENQGRLEDAENSIRKAVALDPENITVLDGYANFLFYQGRYEEATQQWQIVIKLAPDHYAALVNLGSALNEIGRTAEAITMYERATDIKPTYMGYTNLGAAYAGEDRFDEAVAAFKKALEIDDTDWLAWGNLAFVYTWKNGLDARSIETFEKAIELAESAKQQNSRDPYVYSDLALYYARTNHSELALQRINTAITLASDSGEIMVAAAETHELIGQREKAIKLAKKSLELGYTWRQLKTKRELLDLLKSPEMQELIE